MLIVGLTGGMGVGKSTVAGLLSELGAEIIDVDALGRKILEPGGLAVPAVIERFGANVAGTDGGINRAALAEIVFGDEDHLTALEEISHPAINELMDQWKKRSENILNRYKLGIYTITPVNPSVCNLCDFQSLCRIYDVGEY